MWMHPDAKIRYRASDISSTYTLMPSTSLHPRHEVVQAVTSSWLAFRETLSLYSWMAIHITCTILKLVAASAAEAELGALFLSAQEAKVIWLVLVELEHLQPPTPIHIDNTTTVGTVNNTIKIQLSRAMEMRYFWLLNSKVQKLFRFHYQLGQENLGDCPSKHHSANIHQHVCLYYVHC